MLRGAIASGLALLAGGLMGRAGGAEPDAVRPIADMPAARRPVAARLANPEEVRRRLGLVPAYQDARGVEAIKVAVLDYGFDGAGRGRGYLPENAIVVEDYDPDFVRRFDLGDPDYRKPFEPLNRHGRVMAQVVWAVTGSRPGGPKFFLLNANGPTMLRRAVRYAIEQGVDIILFSGSFEGGGNGDGRGPINRVVDEALARDILWINAAGNYGKRVYNGPVGLLSDGYVRLRGGSDIAALRFRNRVDENTVTVTLTWNDYRDAEDAGTDKDLDLYVEDWTGRIVGKGEKVQVSGDRPAGPDGSRNPRERVVLTDLPAGLDVPNSPDYGYRIRVRAKRGRFTSADRLRVLVTASRESYVPPGADAPREAVEFVDATGEEELFPPADNPRAITVGDSSPASSLGPTADRRVKPDLLLEDSRVYLTDGEVSAGSSNAAAYFAGVAAVLKAAAPGLRPRHLMRLARDGETVSVTRDRQLALPSATLPPSTRPAGTTTSTPPTRTSSSTSPAPASSRPATAPRLELRAWRTPSRARLDEVLRQDR